MPPISATGSVGASVRNYLAARALGQMLLDQASKPSRHTLYRYKLESVDLLDSIFSALVEYPEYTKAKQCIHQSLDTVTREFPEADILLALLDALWVNQGPQFANDMSLFGVDVVAHEIANLLTIMEIGSHSFEQYRDWVSTLITAMINRDNAFAVADLIPGRRHLVHRASQWAQDTYIAHVEQGPPVQQPVSGKDEGHDRWLNPDITFGFSGYTITVTSGRTTPVPQ